MVVEFGAGQYQFEAIAGNLDVELMVFVVLLLIQDVVDEFLHIDFGLDDLVNLELVLIEEIAHDLLPNVQVCEVESQTDEVVGALQKLPHLVGEGNVVVGQQTPSHICLGEESDQWHFIFYYFSKPEDGK